MVAKSLSRGRIKQAAVSPGTSYPVRSRFMYPSHRLTTLVFIPSSSLFTTTSVALTRGSRVRRELCCLTSAGCSNLVLHCTMFQSSIALSVLTCTKYTKLLCTDNTLSIQRMPATCGSIRARDLILKKTDGGVCSHIRRATQSWTEPDWRQAFISMILTNRVFGSEACSDCRARRDARN
jgi:hypothetical protein